MDNNKTEDQNIVSLVITTLAIGAIVLLGVIAYAYYTKEINPKNKIVEFFLPKNITFNDLPQNEQDKYTLKLTPLKVLEPDELSEKLVQESIDQELKEEVPNKFLKKMAKMQKETDEMILDGKTIENEPLFNQEKKEEVPNKFLKKMAKMQKETDKMILEGKSEKQLVQKKQEQVIKKESRAQELLRKTAKMQKETDEMIIKSNGSSY